MNGFRQQEMVYPEKHPGLQINGVSTVFEKLAQNRTLSEVLDALCLTIEKMRDEIICSMLLIDKKTGRLSHGVAPSLPDFYLKAVNGTPVSMGMGSCGEAAFTAKRVIVEDILIHPNWKNFTSIAVDKAGLRACWSEPVIGSDSKVLGTFAIYYRQPQSPKKEDIELIRSAAYIASIAIEYSMSREQLKQANAKLEHRVIERTKELRWRITEKEQIEIALRKSHEALSESQRMAKLGSWNLDLNTRIITLSAEHQFVAGRECKETTLPLDEYTADYIVEEDIAIIQDQLVFAVQNIENISYHNNFEYRLKADDDGGYKNIAVQIRFKSKGMINGVIQDITDRKQVVESLRKNELKYKTLIDNINSGVAVYEAKNDGEDFIFLDFNKAGEKIENTRRKDLIGKNVLDVFPSVKDFGLYDVLKKVWKTGKPEYFPIALYKDDRISGWRENYVYKLPSEEIITVYNDKTEQKKSETALQESEDKYRNLFNNAEVGMFRTRIDGSEILEMNKRFLEIFGRTREEMQGSPSVILWADQSEREEMLRRLELEERVPDFECRMLNKQGEVKSCLTSLKLYRELEILEGSIVDITERKQAEEERDRILTTSMDLICIARMDGYFKYVNPAWEKLLGYTTKELLSRPFLDFIHPDDRKKNDAEIAKLSEGKETIDFGNRYVCKDGSILYILWTATPHLDEGQMYCIGRNITERKLAEKEKQKLEAQLQQSQKMESIGLLAGGIAHDFNNLLTTIIGYADFAQGQVRESPSLCSEIEEISKAGRKAAALTRQLLAFSRKQIIKPEILNINDILTNTEKMLRRTIGEDIEFKTMFEPELWDVKIDPGQIEQILLNLVVNARDAMPAGGKLTIETANTELDDVYFQNRVIKHRRGSYVVIIVTDTGMGMDEETRSRIFEPFFTTKERGQGTGLGLSTVYGIVKQNNGHIRVYSEPGKGTTFKIYFPRTETDEIPDDKVQLDENRLKGSETILVAEDSKTLLKLTQKMLESYGYKVLTAQSGHEAMETFKGQNGPIHLLLTDVVMPDMNGRELAEQIQSESPKVQVVYMSGYTDDTISKHGILYEDIEFIEKPFSQKDLGLKVRNVLDHWIDDL